MPETRPKHRFQVDTALDGAESVALEPDQATQVSKVLRLRVGERVALFDGDGYDYEASLTTSGGKLSAVLTGARWPARSWGKPDIHLGVALLKADRFDLVVQKAVELGVTRLTAVQAARCVVSLPVDRAAARVERWRRVAREALEQCGRGDHVEVGGPVSFQSFVLDDPSSRRMIAWEREDLPSLPDLLCGIHDSVTILIGPEGGFEDAEVELAELHGFTPVSLGPAILRSETAAIAALAMVRAVAVDRELDCGD